MTKRNIFYKDFGWEKVSDKPFGLFKVTFKNKGEEFTWWPKWPDVRDIFLFAYATECGNFRGKREWEQLLEFERTATRVKMALPKFVEKKTQEERQRIIDLLNQGDFRKAGELLQSGLVEMAEWLKAQSTANNPSGDLAKES